MWLGIVKVYNGGGCKKVVFLVHEGTRYQLFRISDFEVVDLIHDLGQLIVEFLQPQIGKSLPVNRVIGI